MEITGKKIGDGHILVIAEIGNNHNGSYDNAIKMINLAHEAGADCVKFQIRHIEEVYRQRSLNSKGEDLGTEYIVDLLSRFELSINQHKNLFEYCNKKGIPYLCTPWDVKSLNVLEDFGVKAYKVSSADLTNLPLIEKLSQTGKPLILSTGMSSSEEIKYSVDFLSKTNTDFVLLHCNSTYPAPLHDINLNWMHSLKKIHPLIGYSGHERGINVSIAAAALGAVVIERHLTLDRGMEGPDHAASLVPTEFREMVNGIREIEQALGEGGERKLSQGEMINRENLGKSLIACGPLKAGTVLKSKHISARSPGQGLSPQHFGDLLGKTLKRDLKNEDFFFISDITGLQINPRNYNFSRPWGLPVRYHDFKEYANRVSPDVWEFHLSYSDMDIDPRNYLSGPYGQDFVVHAPELFSGSHLMDLASPNSKYRERSIFETQRVLDITRDLKQYFPNTERPMIVANVGGFSMDANIDKNDIVSYYERFSDSLTCLNLDGVELIPQTMAPFPWHFGGQRYQNIFVQVEEIVQWCDKLNLRMCFDISHSRLMCNYFKLDFYEFAKKVAPYTAHLHLGDASGVNGEGLQIGKGDIDFERLGLILDEGCPNASFIPEIWQGHKNYGEGFWIALDLLEKQI
jgi:sialic acid synthase SpsE/sugar phosphate isomerase/epimerase